MLIRLLLVAAFSLLPAAGAHAERAVRSLLEMRQENLIIQQWDNSCGAAALATILTFDRGYPVTEQQVAQGMLRQTDALRVRHRGGFSLLDMQQYAASLGFQADGYTNMTLEDLATQSPMIVPIRVRGYDHFVIVRRVMEHTVDIADPGFGNYRMRIPEFSAAWPGIGFQVGARAGGS
ncbi:MAG TPA: C39 family peptidase [Noviherbaspirillum sp.]|uniref:C39 family peptidase n=1 Tax=Noviherbaspirillum sp. TaxID=1926288 RepID=UPI002D6AF64E|nr:C39 family peptidase [Noviherbaspirillum sp.]HYD95283.1 C39 family peptidase [Noviherbaspirillum sp.]